MDKPSYQELISHPERFEPYDVRVETYRDKTDGNLLFVTDTGEVLDGFVKVSDPDRRGVPVVGRFDNPMRQIAVAVLRGLARLVSPLKGGIGAILSQNLLAASKQDGDLKELLKQALSGSKRDVLADINALIRRIGTRKLVGWLDRVEEHEVSKEDFLKQLLA